MNEDERLNGPLRSILLETDIFSPEYDEEDAVREEAIAEEGASPEPQAASKNEETPEDPEFPMAMELDQKGTETSIYRVKREFDQRMRAFPERRRREAKTPLPWKAGTSARQDREPLCGKTDAAWIGRENGGYARTSEGAGSKPEQKKTRAEDAAGLEKKTEPDKGLSSHMDLPRRVCRQSGRDERHEPFKAKASSPSGTSDLRVKNKRAPRELGRKGLRSEMSLERAETHAGPHEMAAWIREPMKNGFDLKIMSEKETGGNGPLKMRGI